MILRLSNHLIDWFIIHDDFHNVLVIHFINTSFIKSEMKKLTFTLPNNLLPSKTNSHFIDESNIKLSHMRQIAISQITVKVI